MWKRVRSERSQIRSELSRASSWRRHPGRASLAARRDTCDVLHDVAGHVCSDRRVSEKRTVIERPGQHVEEQLDLEALANLATRSRSLEGIAHRLAARGEYLFTNGGGELGVLRPVRDKPGGGL